MGKEVKNENVLKIKGHHHPPRARGHDGGHLGAVRRTHYIFYAFSVQPKILFYLNLKDYDLLFISFIALMMDRRR